jgi:type IV pilus assembly protein PilY1
LNGKQALAALLASCIACQGVVAGTVDLANVPLFTSSNALVKPNLLFVLDDSGSMDFNYMPDIAGDVTSASARLSSQCNGLAYNPAVTYQVPLTSAGAEVAAGTLPTGFLRDAGSAQTPTATTVAITASGTLTFSFATNSNLFSVGDAVTVYQNGDTTRWMIGTVTGWTTSGNPRTMTLQVNGSLGSGDLSNLRVQVGSPARTYYRYVGTITPALGYTYSASGAAITTTDFYRECSGATGAGNFQQVTVASDAAEAQNYANWYSYHRKRMLTMRTAVSRAFRTLDSQFRVGFTTINNTSASGSNFLNVSDFDQTQKDSFYSKLNGANPSGSTPLRGALARAGQYYANKASGQTADPVQYACQKNVTLLSTDGYWNETGTPKQLDGTTDIGQQDGGGTARPMYDGETTTVTTTTRYDYTETRDRTALPVTTSVYRRYLYSEIPSNCSGGRHRNVTQEQRQTVQRREQVVLQQRRSCYYIRTATVVDGVPNSDTNGTPVCGSWTDLNPATTTVLDEGLVSPTGWADRNGPSQSSCTFSAAPASPSAEDRISGPSTSGATSYTYSPTAQSTAVAGTPSSTSSTANGVANTLADVAMYYYKTDLRSSALNNATGSTNLDVSANDKVEGSAADPATWQHMKTFTLGLGLDGLLGYRSNYDQGGSPDFNRLKDGTLNWPAPSNNTIKNVDDLWHAAVNGRGKYFNAKDPQGLARSLTDALISINAITGGASSAATSTLRPVQGDNKIFVAEFKSGEWIGDVKAYSIDPNTGAVNRNAVLWSARDQLGARVSADATASVESRTLYVAGGQSGGLQPFTYANVQATGHFDGFCNKPGVGGAARPAQCSGDDFNVAAANDGANLVAWLRGKANPLYRQRTAVLGDIVNGAPVHLSKPSFLYTENGYGTFKSQKANRARTVFVGGNDGMLHSLDAASGEERWAFVPTAMLPKLYRLADSGYPAHHEFFVDGTPTIADIHVAGVGWKTILVGGFNAGGRGYYALDVTDPTAPQLLWEFTDANLGLSFGNPIITKRASGEWVVVFASGYNGTDPGKLFVLNANTGTPHTFGGVNHLATPEGFGLAKLNAWVDSPIDNTARRFYGGDMEGNLWRFDLDRSTTPSYAVQKLAKFQVAGASRPQPITTRPLLGMVTANGADREVVFVATGRYLGTPDLSDTSVQSIYAIEDKSQATGLGDVRLANVLVRQTLDTGSSVRRVTSLNPVDWSQKRGWYVDLPAGERVNVDMSLAFNTLTAGANVPSDEPCAVGGNSWLYELDVASGDTRGEYKTGALVVGMTSVILGSNADGTGGNQGGTYVNDSKLGITLKLHSGSSGIAQTRRTAWRELAD